MKKGITLAVEVYLEGEQDPAADFAALATSVVRSQLESAFNSHPQGLTLQIKKLQEQDDSGDDSGVVLAPQPAASTPIAPPPAATPAPPGARPPWISRIFPRGGKGG